MKWMGITILKAGLMGLGGCDEQFSERSRAAIEVSALTPGRWRLRRTSANRGAPTLR